MSLPFLLGKKKEELELSGPLLWDLLISCIKEYLGHCQGCWILAVL